MRKSVLACFLVVFSCNGLADDLKSDKHAKGYKDVTVATAAKETSWLDNFSGSMTFVSNYVFRGLSQSENLPAVQGSLYYTFPIGVYLNLWGSNVKFNDDSGASVELDTIAGYRNTIGDNFSYDLSFARYNYPGASQINYNELIALANFYFLQASYAYAYDYSGLHVKSNYFNGGINYTIPSEYFFNIPDVSIVALVGHDDFDSSAVNSYSDYSIAISKKIKNYAFTLQWTGTNGNAHNSPYDGNQIIAQLAANF